MLLCAVVLVLMAGCQTASQVESRRVPGASAIVRAVVPERTSSAPANNDCGIGAYPVSKSAQEILAAVPRQAKRPPNSGMLVRVAIDTEGRITHLRVLRPAYPNAPNTAAINAQVVDSIKRWHYAPTIIANKPVAVCSDVTVNVDF
jgi:outer membrane biosynthesis protein TonB